MIGVRRERVPGRVYVGAVVSQIAIVLVAAALIGLAWLGSITAIRADREQAEARVEAAVGVEALAFEEQVSRQLMALDQTLRFARRVQQANPAEFDLAAWQSQATLLHDIGASLFLTDEDGQVRAAGTPEAIGLDLSGTPWFRVLLAQTDATDRMEVGPAERDALEPGWHMILAIRLRHPDGSFAGAIGLTYGAAALSHFFSEARLAHDDMIAVVGTDDARLRAEVGPVAAVPDTWLHDSAMFQALEEMPDGEWIGPSATDGIERIHAFRHVPGQALEVVVGVERNAALAAATTWAKGARFFAVGITALVLLMAGLLLREVRAARQRALMLGKEHARLAASNAELEAAKARADAKTAQLEATLAGMTDGVAMVDANHALMEWNVQFSEISGVPHELLRVGTTMEQMVRYQAQQGEFGAVDVEAEVARRMRILHSGKLSETNERARPNGKIIELRRNYLPDGGMVTLYTDVTARKQVENALRMARAAAEEASAARARFVTIVSHEIRTPLNALLNSLVLLAEGEMLPKQRVLVDVARQSGDALLALINDILDMSRLEAGQLSLRRSVFALRPLLTGAMEMMRPLAARRGITLQLVIRQNVPHLLFSDAVRLRQVLLNMLSNAAKYAAPGEVLLTAEAAGGEDDAAAGDEAAGDEAAGDEVGGAWAGGARAGEGDAGEVGAGEVGAGGDGAGGDEADALTLRLAVRDQGPAIPDVERARLFQPFSQLDQPGAELQPGSGLGLAICRLLATLMGGEVGCDMVELAPMGQPRRTGNEFWLTLPVAPLPADAVTSPERPPAGLPMLPHSRLLLVEDVIASRVVVARLLRRVGHMVDTAASGEEAIAAVARHPYDAVLMDVHMPGISGIDAARQIRMLPGAAGAVPMIALTATVSPEETMQCRAAGMEGLVTKPAALADLLGAIGQYAWPGRGFGVLQAVKGTGEGAQTAEGVMAAGLNVGTGAPEVPVLAAARLAELRQHLAPAMLGKLVEDGLLDLQQRLPKLRDALGAGDAHEIVEVAHAMAGVAGGYGMAALEARLRAVMNAVRVDGPVDAVAAAETLEADLARAATALRESLRIEMV